MSSLLVKDATASTKYVKRSGLGTEASPYSEFASALGDGRITSTTPGTAVAFSAVSVPCKRVIVRPRLENAELVVVGGSTALAGSSTDTANTRRGIVLQPGDIPLTLEVDDLQKIYLDVVTSGDGVQFVYERMV